VNRDLRERFLATLVEDSPYSCWSWAGSISVHGYGQLKFKQKTYRAHRLSHEIFIGPIPDGLFVCHHCDNPSCVNPAHLYAGTPKQNSEDRDRRGRANIAHGERHYRATLTDDDVVSIRESNKTLSELEDEFGVSRTTICNVQLGKTRVSAGGPIRDRVDTHRKTDTHCANGHELNEKSVYVYPKNGKTYCRVCGAKSARMRKARIREEKRKAKGEAQ
jgi:hypothetical protein